MSKKEERRKLTKEFVNKIINKQSYDAAIDLDEIIKVSKELRCEEIFKDTEI